MHPGIYKVKRDVRCKIILQICHCTPIQYFEGEKKIYFYLVSFLQLFASLFFF